MTNSATKSAIVTGASGGIGGSIAKRLAKDGFSVVVNYAGKPTQPKQLSQISRLQAHRASLCKQMWRLPQTWSGFLKRRWTLSADPMWWFTVRASCRCQRRRDRLRQGDRDKLTRNLPGIRARAAQHVLDGGRIMAFSSSVLTKSFPTYGAYIASKAGVEGMVHVLANELRGRNITVNAVAPGPSALSASIDRKSGIVEIRGLKRVFLFI